MALLMGLLVTFLWSTSYVLVKIGLHEVPPLTFAAYRYMIASTALFILTVFTGGLRATTPLGLPKLVFLGLTGYSVAQGLQYLGLYYLPAVSVTFLLNFTPIWVLLLTRIVFHEFPVPYQFGGMLLTLLGAYLFFRDPLSGLELRGLVLTLLSGLGWATYMVSISVFLKRDNFRSLTLTSFSMFFGALPLLALALLIEGPMEISLSKWAIIVWLSLVNTAFAFVLWNHVLKKIRAFELSILQNTMLIQIGLLAFTFLGEDLTAIKIMAMAIVFIGVLVVQMVKPK